MYKAYNGQYIIVLVYQARSVANSALSNKIYQIEINRYRCSCISKQTTALASSQLPASKTHKHTLRTTILARYAVQQVYDVR